MRIVHEQKLLAHGYDLLCKKIQSYVRFEISQKWNDTNPIDSEYDEIIRMSIQSQIFCSYFRYTFHKQSK